MGDWGQLKVQQLTEDDTSATSYGVTLSAPGGSNTKGAYTQLVSSTPFNVCGLILSMQVDTGHGYLVDIAVGAGGSEQVRIPNIPFGIWGTGGGDTHGMMQIFVPVSIPKGTRIAARYQKDAAASTAKFKLTMLAETFMGLQAPRQWQDWGTNTGTSVGTTVTGGSANTKGSYAQIVASSDFDTRWLLLNFIAGSIDDMSIDISVGAAASEQVKIPDLHTTNEHWMPNLLIPCYIPKGTRISARLASGTGGSTCSISILGGN